jgi:hypothetical protein
VGEQKSVQQIRLFLKDQGQTTANHGTDIRLKMGAGIRRFNGRIPYLHGNGIHGPENLSWILGRKNTKQAFSRFFLPVQVCTPAHAASLSDPVVIDG